MGFSKWLNIIKMVAPAALIAAGVPPTLTTAAIMAMQEAESAITSKGSGAEKKDHAMGAVLSTAQVINEVHDTPIIDMANLRITLDKGIDAAVAAANLKVKKDTAQ